MCSGELSGRKAPERGVGCEVMMSWPVERPAGTLCPQAAHQQGPGATCPAGRWGRKAWDLEARGQRGQGRRQLSGAPWTEQHSAHTPASSPVACPMGHRPAHLRGNPGGLCGACGSRALPALLGLCSQAPAQLGQSLQGGRWTRMVTLGRQESNLEGQLENCPNHAWAPG